VAVGSGSPSYACPLGGADGRTLVGCTAPSWGPGTPRGRIEVAGVDVAAPAAMSSGRVAGLFR
jgi:hypothetical protein